MEEIHLNDIELAILKMVALGYENKVIAKRLFLSIHSIKAYITVILKKLNAENRTHATYIALRDKIIPPDLTRDD